MSVTKRQGGESSRIQTHLGVGESTIGRIVHGANRPTGSCVELGWVESYRHAICDMHVQLAHDSSAMTYDILWPSTASAFDFQTCLEFIISLDPVQCRPINQREVGLAHISVGLSWVVKYGMSSWVGLISIELSRVGRPALGLWLTGNLFHLGHDCLELALARTYQLSWVEL